MQLVMPGTLGGSLDKKGLLRFTPTNGGAPLRLVLYIFNQYFAAIHSNICNLGQ